MPLARIDAVAGDGSSSRAEARHLHTDQLGTPRELTDADGRVVWAARYRAWGNVLQVVHDEASALPAAEELAEELGSVQPVRFQGQYFDDETGLHYNRFRYYDPDVGRFVSIDPIGLAGGPNTYQYTSNPTYWVDPLGLAPCDSTGKSGANGVAAVGDTVPPLGPGWSVISPRGPGSATGPVPPGYTTVSRWVKPEEVSAWTENGGTAVPNGVGGDRVYVTALNAAKPGGTGPVRIDFAVPTNALRPAGKPEWFQMFQPMPSTPIYNVQIHVPSGIAIPRENDEFD